MIVSEEQKELWIDLHSLISSSTLECGCCKKNTCPDGNPSYLVIYYQYSKKHPEGLYNPTIYLLRKALRALGHKITKIDNHLYDDLSAFMCEYTTSITEKEYRESAYWNEWVGEITTEHYGYVQDTDTDTDDEEEEEDEEQDEENPT